MNKPDILETLQAEGIALKQRANNFWACCPFHSEKTPSFKVDPARQSFYCFSCREKGDVIDFVMKYKGLSFKDACGYLGIEIGRPSQKALQAIARAQQKRKLVASFRAWESAYHSRLCLLYRALQGAKERAKTIEDVEKLTPFYYRESSWLAHLEILEGRDDTAKFELFMGGDNE